MSLTLVFYIISFASVVSALLVVLNRRAVYSVIFLVLTFFCLASLFLLLGAYFLAVLEILIYAGAIMVLFLFVIMLLNVGREEALPRLMQLQRGFSLLLVVVFFLGLALMIIQAVPTLPGPRPSDAQGDVATLGVALFTKYLFPFEVASLLLFVALIGTVYLAKRKI